LCRHPCGVDLEAELSPSRGHHRSTFIVHINPVHARAYFRKFRPVLKPGGRSAIHHVGPPRPVAGDRPEEDALT
jgi:hypothetical protein